jgi:hypothetical protein
VLRSRASAEPWDWVGGWKVTRDRCWDYLQRKMVAMKGSSPDGNEADQVI